MRDILDFFLNEKRFAATELLETARSSPSMVNFATDDSEVVAR